MDVPCDIMSRVIGYGVSRQGSAQKCVLPVYSPVDLKGDEMNFRLG